MKEILIKEVERLNKLNDILEQDATRTSSIDTEIELNEMIKKNSLTINEIVKTIQIYCGGEND